LNDGTSKDANPVVATCAHFLEASPQVSPFQVKVEELVSNDKPLFDEEHSPEVKLKPLPFSLRYKFLGLNSTYPMIINASLSVSQIDSLLRMFTS